MCGAVVEMENIYVFWLSSTAIGIKSIDVDRASKLITGGVFVLVKLLLELLATIDIVYYRSEVGLYFLH